jgi:glycosyltransferase involved in cell wall biosynthesis
VRILVLNFEYPPVGGGGGRVSAFLAQALERRGHQLLILTTGIRGTRGREVETGVEVVRLRTGRRSASRASFLSMLSYVVAAGVKGMLLVRTWKPDVLHAHFAVPTGAAAWLVSRLTGIRYVLTVHLGDVPGGVPEKTSSWFRWVGRLTPPIWRRAAAVVAVSEHTRDLARRRYDVPIRVVPNGVPLDGRPRQAAPVASPPVIAFVGRFQRQKDPLFAVELLAEIGDAPWQAVLVGDGPLRPAVEERIRQAGLSGRVRLTGWLEPEAADRELAAADILLMPSHAEGLPVVGVQALVHGVAIVGSRVGGLSELIVDGVNGYGLTPGDRHGFVRAMRSCLENRTLLAGLKAGSYSMASAFDVAKVAETYEAILAGAVRK